MRDDGPRDGALRDDGSRDGALRDDGSRDDGLRDGGLQDDGLRDGGLRGGRLRGVRAAGMRLWADIRAYKAGILAFAVYYAAVHLLFRAFCPLVMLTGLPCAGCGMTRAVYFLLTGQFGRSWQLNPMAFPVLLFLLYCAAVRYVFGKRIAGGKVCAAILCLCMLAVYLYRMGTVFPGRPPYVYTGGNLMERFLPFYKEILHRLLGV